MLVSLIWAGIQQDLKVFIFAPLLCAVFRAIFIWRFHPHKSWQGKGLPIFHCFRYGFWWGMDFNAYVFLFSFTLVTLPGAFFPAYFALGDQLRTTGLIIYVFVLYTAFVGKMIFYNYYRDIYNRLLWLGRKAEKRNLLDVFLNENHGWLLLLSYLPVLWGVKMLINQLLGLPELPGPELSWLPGQYLLTGLLFLLAIAFFYYFRYGGSFSHDDKPEWDTIPSIVKKDIFLARATVDDLVALENVWKHPLEGLLTHTDAQDAPAIVRVLPGKWEPPADPMDFLRHTAQGARITKPKHIFLLVGESYSQMPLDPIYASLHLADGAKRLRQDPHTVFLNHFLPAGVLSRPAIVGLMTGIFDARLELNEREDFWQGTVPTALPLQLKKLGYSSIYWYGGNSTYGNFNQFAPAAGFDRVMAATDFCPPDSPRTWVGVYDHIFLEQAAERIRQIETPTFHFLYTTSNHGPFKIPLQNYGYDPEKVMPAVLPKVKNHARWQKIMGTHWYSDQAIDRFLEQMRIAHPDSLFLVTGDHASLPIPLELGIMERREHTLREYFCTSFAMYHRELSQKVLAGNTIGGHLNLLPTILELIAPAGFTYYSLFESLTQPIEQVITPYHWLTNEAIGATRDPLYQELTISSRPVPSFQEPDGRMRFTTEVEGYTALTGWLARHPELLQPAAELVNR